MRDIDRNFSEKTIESITKATGHSKEAILKLTLNDYNGLFYESAQNAGIVNWILPLGIYHRKRRRPAMQFCPTCLKNDKVAYYRKYWRLAFHVICTEHHCFLQNKCPKCYSPIMFYRHGIGKNKRKIPENFNAYCAECLYDLSKSKPEKPQYNPYCNMSDFLKFYSFSTNHDISNLKSGIQPISFFLGLRVIMRLLFFKRLHGLVSEVSSELHIEFVHLKKASNRIFEWNNTKVRYEKLLLVYWVMSDWPDRFIQLLTKHGMTRSRVCEKPPELPFWLYEIVDTKLEQQPYYPNFQEMESAYQYMLKNDESITKETFAKKIGIHKSSLVRVWSKLIN